MHTTPAAGDADLEFSGQVVKVGVAGQQLIGSSASGEASQISSHRLPQAAAGDVRVTSPHAAVVLRPQLHQALQTSGRASIVIQ